MATMFVRTLGLGTGKYEGDIAAEIFAAFGIDLAALVAGVPQRTPDRAAKLCEVAAKELSRKAPTTGAIVAEIARTSGLLAAMMEQVYELLSDHDATTTGTTKEFRIEQGDIGDIELPLSRAFFEEVTRLVARTVTLAVDDLNFDALHEFILLDNGVPYGRWPVTNRGSGTSSSVYVLRTDRKFFLAASALQTGKAVKHLEARATSEPDWVDAARVAVEALTEVESLAQAAESVVTKFASRLSDLADNAPNGVPVAAYVAKHAYGVSRDLSGEETGAAVRPYLRYDDVIGEVERYLHDGFLGAWASFLADDIPVAHEVGMCKGEPLVKVTKGDPHSVSPVAELAAWCAMFRKGLDPSVRAEERTTPDQWTVWLEQLKIACTEATSWFGTTLILRHQEITRKRVLEEVAKLLNLPLWRRRDLLYEVWLLSATLRACEQASWTVRLTGLDSATRAWVLPGSRAVEPVAYLERHAGGERLEVWREPLRKTGDDHELTPDVTISIPGPRPLDLVVVEAKDQIKMAEGKAQEVARRYADGLSPRLTWVCNHCDFRAFKAKELGSSLGLAPAERNHGDPWHAIYVAELFRPGSVPAMFAESIGAAIRPLHAGGAARP